jgi:hypothetical protein
VVVAIAWATVVWGSWPPQLSHAEDTQPEEKAFVYVFLWFDTEDYLLPEDDDATKRLAEYLSRQGIRATFKLVGEKLRVLERRKRSDVLEALRLHDIGYHSEFHSVHPTPAQYLSRLGWDTGVREFLRRERHGVKDIERVFGVKPSCYGQPGSSWGPQQFGALKQLGISVYLDHGSHVRLEGRPFWYCGILNLYALRGATRTGLSGDADLRRAMEEFDRLYHLLLKEGGGPISVVYHPCEFVHAQFWDAVNFKHGANPPPQQWRVPPKKSKEESELAFRIFERYVELMKAYPRVRFATAREALELYPDRAQGRLFSAAELQRIAQRVVAEGITYQHEAEWALSPAEVFSLLTKAAKMFSEGRRNPDVRLTLSPLGPTEPTVSHEKISTDLSQLTRTIHDVESYLEFHQRVPNAVWLGSKAASPEAYLKTVAAYVAAGGRLAVEPIDVIPAELATARFVRADDPALWGWVIFPPGFRAPDMMELARLQAWTLKPALLASAASSSNN